MRRQGIEEPLPRIERSLSYDLAIRRPISISSRLSSISIRSITDENLVPRPAPEISPQARNASIERWREQSQPSIYSLDRVAHPREVQHQRRPSSPEQSQPSIYSRDRVAHPREVQHQRRPSSPEQSQLSIHSRDRVAHPRRVRRGHRSSSPDSSTESERSFRSSKKKHRTSKPKYEGGKKSLTFF